MLDLCVSDCNISIWIAFSYLNVVASHIFPGGPYGKSVCLQCGRLGFDPWVGEIPWRRKWQPTLVLLPGKSYGWRSLVGYTPWSNKELDTTEWLHFLSFLSYLNVAEMAGETASSGYPLRAPWTYSCQTALTGPWLWLWLWLFMPVFCSLLVARHGLLSQHLISKADGKYSFLLLCSVDWTNISPKPALPWRSGED